MSQPMVLSDKTTAMNRTRPLAAMTPTGTTTAHGIVDDERRTKRRCSNNDYQQQQPSVTSMDCYDEVTSPSGPTALRQDWFYQIPHLSKHTANSTAGTTHQLQQQQQQHLLQLDQQLQQVKRRFGPAAERCAEAVLRCQGGFAFDDSTASREFEFARRAGNPYEVLGVTKRGGLNHGLFLNRSAIKLANIDALLDFTLTNTSANNNSNTFTFVDLCAAPGGFSEYICRRFCHSITRGHRQQSCRGFGMSLVGDNDQGHGTPWKLSEGPLLMGNNNCKGSVNYHICKGADGTGDIFQWANVQALQQMIASYQQQHQQPPLVDLVLADGGVDAQRNVEHPEGETQKLVVCQVAAALSMLQPGGRFVLKLLSCQTTPVLQTVMNELMMVFEHLQICKPISSRPASAERYLVCTGFSPPADDLALREGPRWISRVLLGQRPVPAFLQAWLAQVDANMMTLNLKACFRILSHLESKTMRLTQEQSAAAAALMMQDTGILNNTASCMEHDDDDDAWIAQGFQSYHQQQHNQQGKNNHKKPAAHTRYYTQQSTVVNAEDYRMAWRLF